ncbi:RNA polymerase sigma factor [Mumia zhuanghuii]|uniref:RNA polymerase sigma factor n=1 Tax=Mumia zhuanghuii TaxID=2585211 RepID=A0A5C4MLK3_9ACTN|nr:RNA polymerase sigma factor [Mumia zhuanghuii]TNC43279.1 RNA polymerase sigma factor [Mumia zhuanghuii]TNC47460.1 RNA polymerase sigma factor [Mumia zhuanghuii]
MPGDVGRTIDAIWRIESARVVAGLVRVVHDIGYAEDLAQDALVIALEKWPREGVPDNPGAWLTKVARNLAVDKVRREQKGREKYAVLAPELDEQRRAATPDPESVVEDPVGDDVLRLVFVACHPVLARDAQVALTLRMLGGLSTEEIARAFLVPSATVGQRVSRAKRTLSEARVPFEVPSAQELPDRLAAVLEVLYLIFNEGYSASSGDRLIRDDLCGEAMRQARVLTALLPREPEPYGLVALMEIQASRFAARTDRHGDPVLLDDQDRTRWDRTLIRHGLRALDRAVTLGRPLGPYTLQAAIAACHARAATPEETDWERIVALYDGLAVLNPSPVVELNRAVAVSRAYGPAEGLTLLEPLRRDPRLKAYHLLPSVRADLLVRLGRDDEAAAEFEAAAALAGNTHDRRALLELAAAAQERTARLG